MTKTSRSCMIDHWIRLLTRVSGTSGIAIQCRIIEKRLLFRHSRRFKQYSAPRNCRVYLNYFPHICLDILKKPSKKFGQS